TERELGHLAGWRDSRPVRIGNDAWSQRQLDVYGELLSAARRLRDQLGMLDQATRSFLVEVADTAAARWRERDQGIWEIRGEPRHFLYSKVMCWVALDRAVAIADRIGAADRADTWKRQRDGIFEFVVQKGWNENAASFTQYVASDALDP